MGEKYCLFSSPSLSSAPRCPSPDPSLLGGKRSSGDYSHKLQIKAIQPLSVSSSVFLRIAGRARLHPGLPVWFWIQLHQTAHGNTSQELTWSKDKRADCGPFLPENSSSSSVTQETAAPRTLSCRESLGQIQGRTELFGLRSSPSELQGFHLQQRMCQTKN